MKAAFVKVYRLDKAAHLQYIAASEHVRLSYRNTTQDAREKPAAQKRKERRTKKYPSDKLALHGPPDRSNNFVATSPQDAKKRKLELAQDKGNFHPPKTKKQSTSSSQPDMSLMFQKCQVLYNGDKWYSGKITGVDFCGQKKQWMYKISFSDGETTLAACDDPEVRLPKTLFH